MTFPSILFGLAIASLIGAFFHIWKDGGLGKLILYLVLSWFGFWIGHAIGAKYEISILDIGNLHVGMGVLVSVIFLLVGHWLSLIDVQRKDNG